MKRILTIATIAAIACALSSCAIHSGLTTNMNTNATEVVLQGNNYTVVQQVKGTANGVTVLGFGGSFSPLIENARSEMLSSANLVGGSRAVINEIVEVNNKTFVVFSLKTVTVSAYVVEFTE
ncbi:MAG: hypothetical protein LBM68_02110 [Bacteroidales bacterium]|jgi:hypothetical protein|nr:hypothetical protein [Bacteroidales bacterium]